LRQKETAKSFAVSLLCLQLRHFQPSEKPWLRAFLRISTSAFQR